VAKLDNNRDVKHSKHAYTSMLLHAHTHTSKVHARKRTELLCKCIYTNAMQCCFTNARVHPSKHACMHARTHARTPTLTHEYAQIHSHLFIIKDKGKGHSPPPPVLKNSDYFVFLPTNLFFFIFPPPLLGSRSKCCPPHGKN